MTTSDELIERYHVAFSQCNPHRPRPDVRYKRGWFRFYSDTGAGGTGYRRSHFEDMTKTLEERAVTAYQVPAGT